MTVLVFERHPVDPRRHEEFEGLVHRFLEAIRGAPGALWADGAKAFDDEPSYVVMSEWRTKADADAWDAGEAARRFREESDVLLRGEVTIRRFGSD